MSVLLKNRRNKLNYSKFKQTNDEFKDFTHSMMKSKSSFTQLNDEFEVSSKSSFTQLNDEIDVSTNSIHTNKR